ncbi:Rsd/AlgQ family anti-sigma factor [Saccharospirillum impatiens]|uniref:Rsd/AlgQ family anti-sigma factor n=1 Tax=Saccharospirillum impatiens TaxID=169438 RepID=UPI000422A328|nr:Rsd/AlgQ family anti-sigma factor [Saccharospirillum impatiens]
MLEHCKTARERWGGTHKMIDRWLGQRQETLVRYFDISSDTAADQQSTLLQSFCESLMDYVSAGHFEVYEQLVREAREFDDGGLELARKLYPKVEATTRVIVDFNDKYDTRDHTQQHVSDLPTDLSKLGEAMTERFEMEDQMIERLHNIHKEQVA